MSDTKDYIFNIGDEVITIYGHKGTIIDICKCEECQKRGFCEPIWKYDDNEFAKNYITNGDFNRDFTDYYKIGNYYFSPFRKDQVKHDIDHYEAIANRFRKRLALIEELEQIERSKNA